MRHSWSRTGKNGRFLPAKKPVTDEQAARLLAKWIRKQIHG